MARIRSPNYPVMSLRDAIEKTALIWKAEGKNPAAREVLAKVIGYGGINGASATSLSALSKYGLLEKAGEDGAKVSALGLRIVYPNPDDPADLAAARQEAAFRPQIFADIRAKWPDSIPSNESLGYFLHQKGFSNQAVKQVISFYHEIVDMAGRPEQGQVAPQPNSGEAPMTTPQPVADLAPLRAVPVMEAAQATSVVTATAKALGRPFMINFDGQMLTGSLALKTAKDVDRLIRILTLQRGAFAAMEEEDEDDVSRSDPLE